MRPLRFRLLGPLRVTAGEGDEVPLGPPKQRALLACLLLDAGAVVPRDRLVDALWGEHPPQSAVQALQLYVHGLRRGLGAERIETHGAAYRIRVQPGELDVAEFERLVERARRAAAAGNATAAAGDLEAALAAWAGPALTDLPADAPVSTEAARLEERRLEAVELRNDVELERGRHAALVAELAQLVAAHPFRERLRRQLILALYRSGRQGDALDAYQAARRFLADELGLEPGPELRELELAILRQEPWVAAPGGGERERPWTLPAPATPLIGRTREVAEVVALFAEDGARLVTLTGPGGTGKTRLALAAAAKLAEDLPDGALFVDLSPVSDPALLTPTVAAAVGARETDGSIAEHVRARRGVLVLDNLEQLLEGTPFIAELLAAAPRLLVLATSRAALRLSAEQEYAVPPLPAPGAVELFAARARAVDRSFELAGQAAQSVERICRRLDGLPLAIELAAARTRLLTPEQIEDRLEHVLDVLVGGPRDLPARQRTLRSTLDWSHDALGEGERRVFARLAVFAGGFEVDAAEAVCADPAALAALAALAEVSLLRRRPSGARFTMLETIREYALERLEASGEERAARERHCRHFLALAERTRDILLTGNADESVYAALDADHDNLRAALDWAAAAGEVELESGLASALRQYWIVRGHLGEGRAFFERAVAHTEGADPRVRATTLMHGGPFLYRQGALEEAKAWWEEALALMRDLGDADGVARCAGELGAVAFSQGELETAAARYAEAGAGFQALGDRQRLAIVVANLGEIATMRGDLRTALAHAREAVAIQRGVDDRDGAALSLHTQARIHRRLGEREAAREAFAESLAVGGQVGYREVMANCLEAAAEVLLARGESERGARLLACAYRALDEMGVTHQSVEAEDFAATRAALAERLGESRLAAIEREAGGLAFDQAVEEARDVLGQSSW